MSYIDTKVKYGDQIASDKFLNNELTEIADKDLSAIPAYRFYKNSYIKKLNFPNCTTISGANALVEMTNLEHLSLPKLTTVSANGQLALCNKIKRLFLPKLTNLYAFNNAITGLQESIWLADISNLNVNIFTPNLKHLTLGSNTLIPLGTATFPESSPNLEAIHVPVALEASYKAAEGWSLYADKIVGDVINTGTDTAVARNAYYERTDIKSAYMPTVASIGDSAFSRCTNLKRVYMGYEHPTIAAPA